MMMNEKCTSAMHHRCFSWSAALVGAFVGIGLSFLLNLFSIAIGLSMVKTSTDGLVTLAIGGFIGLLIGSIISMFMAGFSAGYLAKPLCWKPNMGALYGFVAWCLALIIMAMFSMQIGRYVAAYTNFVNKPAVIVSYNERDNTTAVNEKPVVNAQTATNTLGYSTFLIFVLFAVSALASAVGGQCGVACRSCHDEKCTRE